MKKVYSFLSLFVFLSFTVNAQYAFKVLAAKGSNQVLVNNAWVNVKPGTKINSNETLKVTKGGYLGLIHKSGKTFEIEQGGEFAISKLESKVKEGKAGFGEKYATFVADGMFAAQDNAAKSYERTGSVTRSGNDLKPLKTSLVIFAKQEIQTLKDKPLKLEWNNCGDGTHSYSVVFKNLFNEEIHTETVSTNSYLLDINNTKFLKDEVKNTDFQGVFLIQITSLKDSNYSTLPQESNNGITLYSVKIINEEESKKIKEDIEPLEKSMDKNSAVDHLILAMAYEKHDLMAYAVENYTKAHELSKDVDAYQIQHDEYIKLRLNRKSLKSSLDE